jgi:hypothetical protein
MLEGEARQRGGRIPSAPPHRKYRDEAMKEFVIDWAEASKLPYEDDTRNRTQI